MLIRKAVGSRKSFVSKMKSLVQQIQKPIGEDMTSILKFHDETAELIKFTDARTVTEYAFLKELFEKEAEKIIQSFRQIVETNNKIGSMLKDFKESNSQLLKAQKITNELKELTEGMKKKSETELGEKLKEVEDEIKKTEDGLKKLVDSDEWKTFLEMERTKEELKKNLQDKKSDFVQCIAKVEKPLKKYEWSAENKILNHYIQGSFEYVLSEDPKGEVFISAIKDIKTKIVEGKLDLKESDKFLAAIEGIIEDDSIRKILEEHSRLSEKLRKQEERIEMEEIPKRKDALESEIGKLRRETEEIEAEKKRIEERKKRIKTDKEQKLKELEILLNNVSGKKILLEVN